MTKKQYKLIIFDCDGTLVDTETLSAEATSHTLKAHGADYSVEDVMTLFIGKHVDTIHQIVKARHPDINLDNFEQGYHKYMNEVLAHKIEATQYARELVELARTLAPIAVGSNGSRQSVLRSLGHTKILELFDEKNIYVGSDVKHPKPAPDLYEHVAAQFNMAVSDCLVLEDTPLGVEAAVSAGMDCIGYIGVWHGDKVLRERELMTAGAMFVEQDHRKIIDYLSP